MKRIPVMALAVSLLAGCSANPSFVQSQSLVDLCVDQLTQPQSGANHDARTQELARRGEDCSQYRDNAQSLASKRQDEYRTRNSM